MEWTLAESRGWLGGSTGSRSLVDISIEPTMKLMITGANGHLGVRLIEALAPSHDVIAVVRSERAATTLAIRSCEVRIVDYQDESGLTAAAQDCDALINLVGIIKQTAQNRYDAAHEKPCRALSAAAASAGLKRIISLSIVGASQSSANGCLASRARADEILMSGTVATSILRVPMVLGENDYASGALLGQAQRGTVISFRPASLEQPIYAGDVVRAIERLLVTSHGESEILELGGPESLPRVELIRRAGRLFNNSPTVVSVPFLFARTLGALLDLLPNPPVTGDMLSLLDHDDCVDNAPALARLDLSLTSLDDMLGKIAGNAD